MVVRVGERIYRKIFPSVAAKHTYEWLESIPRPARHCLSSRKILQDCMVTIPAGARRGATALWEKNARDGSTAPKRHHFCVQYVSSE